MSQLKQISIEKIKTNPYQPRSAFEEESLRQLADSIAENGLLQPISVRETYFGYEVIAGERRLRACQMLSAYRRSPTVSAEGCTAVRTRMAVRSSWIHSGTSL